MKIQHEIRPSPDELRPDDLRIEPGVPEMRMEEVQAHERAASVSLRDLSRRFPVLPADYGAQSSFLRMLGDSLSHTDCLAQVRLLRDALVLAKLSGAGKVEQGLTVALAGPHGGEGSSLISLLVTLALGECGRWRIAHLDGCFDLDRFEALAEILELSDRDGVQLPIGSGSITAFPVDACPGVHFLSGPGNSQSLQFFSDKGLSRFFESLRESFDFTLIHLPPLLRDSAGIFALPLVDQLYLVVEAGKTSLEHVAKCKAAIEERGGKLAGVVINKQRAPFWSRFFWREFFY